MSSAQADRFAKESIKLVNQVRVQARLVRLDENELLDRAAMTYSRRMATERFYGHVDPQGKQASDRIAAVGYLSQMSAENIARGQPDPPSVVDSWLKSPGHRANIMNPDLREIGAGYAYNPTDQYQHYWTHLFATPDPSVGRDRESYPSQVLAQINQIRQKAGAAPVVMHPALESVARSHLPAIAEAGKFRSQSQRTLNEASRAALKSFQRALALTAAGTGTPEDAVTQWSKDDGGCQLSDKELRAAGVAYTFVTEDDYRHDRLLVVGG